jgi:hypothetical protein
MIGAMIASADPRRPRKTIPPQRWVPPSGDVLAKFRPHASGPLERPPQDADEQIAEEPIEPGPPRPSERIAASLPGLRNPSSMADPSPRSPETPEAERSAVDAAFTGGMDDAAWPPPAAQVDGRGGISGIGLYWLAVLILTPVGCVGTAVYATSSGSQFDIVAGLFWAILLGMPAIQLAASFLAACLTLFWPAGDRDWRLLEIGRITLYTIIGTVVGIVAMLCLCLPMWK